ncbi:MAG: transcription termination/antitermination protein NusG [Rickettsiales bacterium]
MSERQWYIVQVLSGHEKKFIDALKLKIDKEGKADLFEEFFVPEEERIVVKRGKKVAEKRKIFPGYVLVKMGLSDDAWHILRSIPKVTGILGDKGKPQALTEAEVNNIYKRIEDKVNDVASANNFSAGENVSIIDGPFKAFSGVVEKVDPKKEILSVTVSIFGRQTPLELRYDQVDKIN